jgi:hypothetical protein
LPSWRAYLAMEAATTQRAAFIDRAPKTTCLRPAF